MIRSPKYFAVLRLHLSGMRVPEIAAKVKTSAGYVYRVLDFNALDARR